MSSQLLLLTLLVVFISLIYGKTIGNINYTFETDAQNANGFLRPDGDIVDVDKREFGRNCVPCKLGLNPCCEPNICKKNRFWFDECMEIKTADSDKHRYP